MPILYGTSGLTLLLHALLLSPWFIISHLIRPTQEADRGHYLDRFRAYRVCTPVEEMQHSANR